MMHHPMIFQIVLYIFAVEEKKYKCTCVYIIHIREFINIKYSILWFMRKAYLLAQLFYVNKSDKHRLIRSCIRIVFAIPLWTAFLASSLTCLGRDHKKKKFWVSMDLIYRLSRCISYSIFNIKDVKSPIYSVNGVFSLLQILSSWSTYVP